MKHKKLILCEKQIHIGTSGEFQKIPCIIFGDTKIFLNFTAFWIYDFIKTGFAEVTTLSRELIFARMAENNRDGFFSKLLVDAERDNLPKSQRNHF